MFLKKLIEKKPITIDYDQNGTIETYKGKVHSLNLKEQVVSLKDEKQKTFTIRLSGIKQIY